MMAKYSCVKSECSWSDVLSYDNQPKLFLSSCAQTKQNNINGSENTKLLIYLFEYKTAYYMNRWRNIQRKLDVRWQQLHCVYRKLVCFVSNWFLRIDSYVSEWFRKWIIIVRLHLCYIKSITLQRYVIVFQFESGTKWDNARFLTIDRRTDL